MFKQHVSRKNHIKYASRLPEKLFQYENLKTPESPETSNDLSEEKDHLLEVYRTNTEIKDELYRRYAYNEY